jgi:hypothetical protein
VQQNHDADARVLTHDTGPMASAQMVGAAIAPVPEEWLLPPEPSEADKRIRSLEAEVARLKDTEPKFRIVCVDSDGKELEKLEFEVAHPEPLSDSQVETLTDRLIRRFPIATEFGGRERIERPIAGAMRLMGTQEVFTPASDKEIEAYRDEYRKWLGSCENRLRNLHLVEKDGAPRFLFAAVNEGNRPANDALVTFRAKGKFLIMPPPYRSNEDDGQNEPEHPKSDLPNPPKAPRGSWRSVGLASLDAFARFPENFGLARNHPLIDESVLRGIGPPRTRDPNGFFYKPDRSMIPASNFCVECQQWRHGVEPELFVGEIHFDETIDQISGALECRIHAENLSEIAAKQVPVRIHVTRPKLGEVAEKLIDDMG